MQHRRTTRQQLLTPAGAAAVQALQDRLPAAVLNHAARTASYANALLEPRRLDAAGQDALAVACVLHELGGHAATRRPQRVDVDRGDFAVDQARLLGIADEYLWDVWLAVAMTTWRQVALASGVIPRLVSLAIQADLGAALVPVRLRRRVESAYPRLDGGQGFACASWSLPAGQLPTDDLGGSRPEAG